jgi:methylglyoxal synthase
MLRAVKRVIALIAHDGRKPDMVAFAMFNRSTLDSWTIVATDSTGRLLEDKVGLGVERVLSGVEGGDMQIAARVATGQVDAVIFLVDPFDRHAHEPDIQGLQRVCQVHDVPLATNMATANLLLEALSFRKAERAAAGG